MEIFDTKEKLISHLDLLRKRHLSIGFVPTMGALHEGHLSLVKSSAEDNHITVVSIFVNPTQFDKEEDLVNYPSTIDQDITLLKSVDCDILFLPAVAEMYGKEVTAAHFEFDGLEFEMEGKHREGHFNGVGTIVKSLFEIVAPNNAYFGEKDFQQLQIVKKMVEKFNIPVQVFGCPIFREPDGLAMSSRNRRLSHKHREEAPFIYATLKKAAKMFATQSVTHVIEWVEKSFEKHPFLELEYFTIADEDTLKTAVHKESKKNYRGFIAAFAGDIRLIDNIQLSI